MRRALLTPPLALALISAAGAATPPSITQPPSTRPVAAEPATAPALDEADARRVARLAEQVFEKRSLGDYAGAVSIVKELLALRRAKQGEHHWETVDARLREEALERAAQLPASAQKELAGADRAEGEAATLHHQQKFDEATALARRVLETRTRLLPPDHVDIAIAAYNLGNSLAAAGKLDEAQRHLVDAAGMFLRIYRSLHPNVAASVSKLAGTFRQQGKFEKALGLYERALDTWRQVLRGDDYRIMSSLNDVGDCLIALNRARAALPYCRDGLAMLQRLDLRESPYLAMRLTRVADCFYADFRWSEALPYYEQALTMHRRLDPSDSSDLAASLRSVGLCLQALSRFEEALKLHEESLAMIRRLHPGDHADVARGLCDAAYCMTQLNRWDDAFARNEEALAMQRRLNPGDSDAVANTLNNISIWFGIRGRASQALLYRQEATDIRRRLHPGDSFSAAIDLDGIGYAQSAMGLHEKALETHRQALAIYRRLAKGDHPTVAISLTTVGDSLSKLARPAEALELYQESFALCRRLGKSADGTYSVALRGLGNALISLGRPEEALPYYQEALSIYSRLATNTSTMTASVPATQPNEIEDTRKTDMLVASSLQMISSNLLSMGRSEQAFGFAEKALSLRKRLYPGDHPDVAASLSTVASALQEMGRPAEAMRFARDTYDMIERLDTEDHWDRVATRYQLGDFLIRRGRAEEALTYYEQAYAMVQRLYTGDNVQRAASMNNLGLALGSLGRYEEALSHFKDSLAMYRRLWEGDDWSIAIGLSNIGWCQGALARANESLDAYREALEIYRRLFNADYPAMAKALSNVGSALFQLRRFDEALPYAEQAVEMARRQRYQQFHFWAANLGRLYLEMGRVDDATALLKEAISQIESLRESAKGLDEQERAAYFAMLRQLGAFEVMVRAQIKRGDGDEALRYLEKGRARSLLDLLDRSRFDPLEQIARRAAQRHDEKLRQRVQQIRLAIDAAEQEVNRLEHEIALARSRPAETTEAANKKHADLEKLFIDQRLARLKQRDAGSKWFELISEVVEISPTREPADIRRLLGPGERLLMYSVTQQDTLLLLVPPPGEPVRSFALQWPDGTAVTQASLTTHVSNYLRTLLKDGYATQRSRVQDELLKLSSHKALKVPQRGEANELQDALQRLDRASLTLPGGGNAGAPAADAVPLGLRLFSALIPASLWPELQKARLVYLVPDGPLHRLPFETLIVTPPPGLNTASMPTALPAALREYWLDNGPPLVYGASGSALIWSHKRRAEQLTGKPSHAMPFEVVALGDPVFSRNVASTQPILMPEKGVLVLNVPAESAGATAGLTRGDVVLTYDGHEVGDDWDLQDRMTEVEKSIRRNQRARDPVRVTVYRAGRRRDLPMAPGRWGVELAAVAPRLADAAIRGKTFDARTMAVERGELVSRFGGLEPLPGTRIEVLSICRSLMNLAPRELSEDSKPSEARGTFALPSTTAPLDKPLPRRDRVASTDPANSAALPPDSAARVKVLLGEDATETELFSAAPQGRFLHLATHQLADETEFASYSALALTLPSVASATDSGFLKLIDLFEHWRDRLDQCELVVLSACETQRGRLQRDEGVFALPWGFMYAGAPSIVASLWRVNDASTADLMSAFYALLQGRDTTKLEAFTQARRQLRAQYPEPYFWAPFIYMGDPR